MIMSRASLVATWRAGRAFATLLALLLLPLLAACGGGTTSADNSGDITPPLPTVVVPQGWATYSNTTYHYSFEYPANWFMADKSATLDYVEVYNFDPTQLDNVEDVPPPPYDKLELDAYANPNSLDIDSFYNSYQQTDTTTPPASSKVVTSITVNGQKALQVLQKPVQWADGQIQYPSMTYFVPSGDTVFILNELYATNNQPSAVFAHMLSSLKLNVK
jgi:hypothetical protein